MTTPLPPALDAPRYEHVGRAGRLAYYVSGEGPPILLIHSINAAASAYEVRPLAERFPGRTVFAVDLPGFGASDRSARDYTLRLYTDAIHDMREVVARHAGAAGAGRPLDAIALSLSCEFLARAAMEAPDAFGALCFVTPTGFSKGSGRMTGAPGSSREIAGVHRFVSIPGVGDGLFRLLVTRASIRYFLKRTWGSPDIDEGLAAYDWISARQPGAKRAPFAFLSGKLFAADLRRVYEALTLPVLVVHGSRGDFADFSETQWASARGNWRFQRFESGALVHFEHPDAVAGLCREFLAQAR